MPVEPGDPLEIDEDNRTLLEEVNGKPTISEVLQGRTRPIETGFAMIAAILFAIGIELYRRKLLEKDNNRSISSIDRKRLFEEAIKLRGKTSLDILHFLSQDPRGVFARELDSYRFQEGEPDPEVVDAFLQKAAILFKQET